MTVLISRINPEPGQETHTGEHREQLPAVHRGNTRESGRAEKNTSFRKRLPYQPHPSRFDHWCRVLTTQSFSLGTYCWEVEAEGAGTISFCEARDTLTHLHTFNDTFTQPVHVGLGLYKAELNRRIFVKIVFGSVRVTR
ncbi:hypothetical protein GN956_G20369 [Arapaima gigas]